MKTTVVLNSRLIQCLLSVAAGALAFVPVRAGLPAGLTANGAAVMKLAGGFAFLEGPAADASGNLYFTDIRNNRIHVWTIDGELKTHREDSGAANGLAFDHRGNLVVCEGGNRRLVSIYPGDGTVTVLADQFEGRRLNSPNDLWVDPKGGVYFTDPRYGNRDNLELEGEWVYYLTPDRSGLIRVADDLVRPNGVLGTPDGKTLYIADHGDNANYVYNVNPDGTLSDKRWFSDNGSDGMALDERGNVYVTSPRNEPSFAVLIFDPAGKPLGEIEVPEKPANIGFAGRDGRTLFITARTSLYSIRMDVRGAPRLASDGWEYLFNGRDLQGWSLVNGTAPFAVVDGAIVGTTVRDSPNSFLATDRTFGDFTFEADFLIEGTANSGVQFRSLSLPEYREGRVHGYQYEFDPAPRAWTAGIYDEARRGWLYPVDLNPSAKTAWLAGRWNRMRIECVGDSIRTWINGIPVAHLIDDLTSEGFFALQIHSISARRTPGDRVRWRNLRVRTIDIEPSPLEDMFVVNTGLNQLSEAERLLGWALLFDGKSTSGWRGVGRSDFPSRGWDIENGELVVRASGRAEPRGGDIVTTESFASFDLQFEFFLTPGANSGVKYFVRETDGSALGLEYQLLDDERHADSRAGAAGNRTLASLYDLFPAERVVSTRQVPRGVGEWQRGRVVAHPDGTVQHWLNGFKVLEYQRGGGAFRAMVARSKFVDDEGFGLAPNGPILLQDHRDEVRFRNIKIRRLN